MPFGYLARGLLKGAAYSALSTGVRGAIRGYGRHR